LSSDGISFPPASEVIRNELSEKQVIMSEFQRTIISILNYGFDSFTLTLKILLTLFLPIIISCIILNLLAKEQNRRLYAIGGWRALLISAGVGTPIHELSHFLAAVIANHKIIELKLFKPDKRTGSMGYMTHSYREDNFFQAIIGNTLIAIAPFFGGAAVIYLMSSYIFPDFSLFSRTVPRIYFLNLNDLLNWESYLLVLDSHLKFFAFLGKKIFSAAMLSHWKTYVFLLLMFGIVNHLSPSGADFKNFWQPALVLMATILLLSLIIKPIIQRSSEMVAKAADCFFVFIPILYLAIFISLLWLLLIYLVYWIVMIFR